MKLLLPVDGSPHSDRVIDHVISRWAVQDRPDIHLLNVQIPVDSGHARMFVGAEALDAYHREEGLAALASARQKLDAAGVPYSWRIVVGHVAPTIVRYAEEQGFERIMIGKKGRSALANILLGSVAVEVSRLARIPVELIP